MMRLVYITAYSLVCEHLATIFIVQNACIALDLNAQPQISYVAIYHACFTCIVGRDIE